MLDSNQKRQLAYLVKVDSIEPIEGRDRVECARVGGWTVMVTKNSFKPGDIGIYFEIDSKVPVREPFMFLEKKHFKIKTQKFNTPNGPFYSQGLLMALADFGWYQNGDIALINDTPCSLNDDSRFLTDILGVVYSVVEDNFRKAKSVDKYTKMLQRNPKLNKKKWVKTLMKNSVGKKIVFAIYGQKRDRYTWPSWVKKTDEERVQNMPWILQNKAPFIVTEKIDGTSTTFAAVRPKFYQKHAKILVCSRNVVFEKGKKEDCYYDKNVYLEMFDKYPIQAFIDDYFELNPYVKKIIIQGETFGGNIQKRDYSVNTHHFMAFNFITYDNNGKPYKYGSNIMNTILECWGIPCVPILYHNFILPDTVDELLDMAAGESVIDGKPREGFVLRSAADPELSFKAVSNEFLVKYHNG